MKLFKFFFSKGFWISISIAAIIGIGSIYFLFEFIDVFTKHGQEIEVPELQGKTLEETESILEENKLNYHVFDSASYNPELPKLSVVSHFPEKGDKVKQGRAINLTLNPNGYRKIKLPDLLNKSVQELEIYFKVLGLKKGNITYKADLAKNIVLEMSKDSVVLKSGDMVTKHSVIDLVIAKNDGDNQNKRVPNILGLKIAEARKMMEDSLYFLGNPNYKATTYTDSAVIIYQMPKPNTPLEIGMQVDIYLTDDTVTDNVTNYVKEIDAVINPKFISEEELEKQKKEKEAKKKEADAKKKKKQLLNKEK